MSSYSSNVSSLEWKEFDVTSYLFTQNVIHSSMTKLHQMSVMLRFSIRST